MKWKLLNDDPQTYAVVFDKDDEAVEELTRFARDKGVDGAQITAIGAFRSVVLGYFDTSAMEYRKFEIDEQLEVLSLVGDIALAESGPAVHAHAVLGRSDASTCGGHLFSGTVWPTLEVVVTSTPGYLRKRVDPETGLALIDLELG